ncbi:MAG: hypothetical protein J07HQX50_00826 [Haloquadratum sp. J07HQX50]|nr:MAG: hypothetical protein J07HQX50_00826 [Haloquadratum sp. J07HQX50]
MDASIQAGYLLCASGEFKPATWAWRTCTGETHHVERLIAAAKALMAAQTGNYKQARVHAQAVSSSITPHPSHAEVLISYIERLAQDPTIIEEASPPTQFPEISHSPAKVRFDVIGAAAVAVAAVHQEMDSTIIEEGVTYAQTDAPEPRGSDGFAGALLRFVESPTDRLVIYRRIEQKVDRRQSDIADVSELFE